jgi:2-methylcitrate dehydratase
LTYENLSKSVVHVVKRHVIDALGCALGCYHLEPARIARAHALEVASTPGATLLGTRHRSSPELAAFANGVMVRYLDFNDTNGGNSGHPSDNVPAVLAAAEYAGADIRTAIAGIVIAYELQDRLGAACRQVRENGWDHVSYVALGSAAGAGRVLNLNREQMAHALALAVVPNAAMDQTRSGRLSMWKGCASPNGARNGVFAALLARRGMTGPDEPFEGSRGFCKQLGTSLNLAPVFGGGGHAFTIEGDIFKSYPCNYEAQCAVTPALELRKVLNGKIGDIAKVEIETYEHAVRASADTRDKWNPASRETADHSTPYVVAVALARGSVWLDDFLDERIGDPEIHALMQKIEVRAVDEYTRKWPQACPYRITVTTKSGHKHVQEASYAKGHPENPMSDREIEDKFRRLTEPVMGRQSVSEALSGLWRMEELTCVSEMMELFVLDYGAP